MYPLTQKIKFKLIIKQTMKKQLFICLGAILLAARGNAQVKIGNNPTNISPNTTLETEATNGSKLHVNKDNGFLGIGDTAAAYKLSLKGSSDTASTIAINDVPVVYLPDQSSYGGSIAFGDGLRVANPSWGSSFANTAVGIGSQAWLLSGTENTTVGLYAMSGGGLMLIEIQQ